MAGVTLILVVIRVADLDRADRFYSALGIRLDRERHGSGPEHLAGQVGTAVLEIYPSSESGSTRSGDWGNLDARHRPSDTLRRIPRTFGVRPDGYRGVAHYGDELLEAIRHRCVRLAIGSTNWGVWSPSKRERFRSLASELRNLK